MLQPKFKIGSIAWTMNDNKPREVEISGVKVFLGKIYKSDGGELASEGDGKQYSFGYFTKQGFGYEYGDNQLFATKQELLQSL